MSAGQSWTVHNVGERILFGRAYLESGFFSYQGFPGTGPIANGTTANCAYNSKVTAILALEASKPDQGSATVNKKAITHKGLLAGKLLEDGFLSESVLIDKAPDTEDWRAKHKAMHWCPASVFTGKLQLLVQSLYGSKRYGLQYVGDLSGVTDIPMITWDGILLNPHQQSLSRFTSLLTTSNYDYFLVQTSTGGDISLTPFKFSKEGEVIRQILRNDPLLIPSSKMDSSNFASRLEAYMLSTAVVDDTKPVHNITCTPQQGKPLYYGWKFDWEGKTGYMVRHEIFLSNGDTEMRMRARYCKLVFNYTYDVEAKTYVFSATETAEETLTWWNNPLSWLVLSRPWPEDHKMVDEMYNEFFIYGKAFRFEDAFTDVPIYCYRDADDAIKVVRISQSLATDNTTEQAPASVTFCGGMEDVEINTRAKNGINGTVSLQDGVKGLTGGIETLGSYQKWILTFLGYYSATTWQPNFTWPGWWEYSVKCSGELARDYCVSTGEFNTGGSTIGKPTGNLVNLSCPSANEEYWLAGLQSARYRLDYEESNGTTSTTRQKIGISIPWYSCNAVISFKQEHKNYRWTGTYSTELWADGKFVKGRTYRDACGTLFYVDGYGEITDICNVKATYNVVSNYSKTWSGTPDRWGSQCSVVGQFAPIAPATSNVEQLGYFDTSLSVGRDQFIYNFDKVKYSLTGGVTYDTAYTTYQGAIDFPGSAAVGWA